MSVWRKLGYGLVLAGLIVALVAQTVQLIAKYYEAPTYFTTAVLQQKDAEFPAVTICPEAKFKEGILKVFVC